MTTLTTDQKKRRPLRLRAFALHQWLGAVVCLYMALVMATGTLSVFDREIDRAMAREYGAAAGPVSGFGDVFQRLDGEFEKVRVVRVMSDGADWAALIDRPGGRYHAFMDGQSGQVALLRQSLSVQRVVRDLHANLMVAHPVGRLAVTIFGVVLLWQIISGLWAYRRFWRGFARMPRAAMPAQGWWGAAHRLVGLWSLPVMLIAALTSVVFLAEIFGFHPKELAGDAPQAREAALPPGFDGAALDGAIAAAQAALPGLEVREVALPGTKRAVIEIEGTTGALLAKSEVTKVLVDPAGGAVLAQRQAQDLGLAGRIYAAAVPLHYGDFGGTASKVVWVVGGLLGTGLALTGALIAGHRAGLEPARRGGMGTIWRGVPFLGRLGLIGALLLAIAMYALRYT